MKIYFWKNNFLFKHIAFLTLFLTMASYPKSALADSPSGNHDGGGYSFETDPYDNYTPSDPDPLPGEDIPLPEDIPINEPIDDPTFEWEPATSEPGPFESGPGFSIDF